MPARREQLQRTQRRRLEAGQDGRFFERAARLVEAVVPRREDRERPERVGQHGLVVRRAAP